MKHQMQDRQCYKPLHGRETRSKNKQLSDRATSAPPANVRPKRKYTKRNLKYWSERGGLGKGDFSELRQDITSGQDDTSRQISRHSSEIIGRGTGSGSISTPKSRQGVEVNRYGKIGNLSHEDRGRRCPDGDMGASINHCGEQRFRDERVHHCQPLKFRLGMKDRLQQFNSCGPSDNYQPPQHSAKPLKAPAKKPPRRLSRQHTKPVATMYTPFCPLDSRKSLLNSTFTLPLDHDASLSSLAYNEFSSA